MDMPDDFATKRAVANDAPESQEPLSAEPTDTSETRSEPDITVPPRVSQRPSLSMLTARLRRVKLVSETPTEEIPATVSASTTVTNEVPFLERMPIASLRRLRWRRGRGKKDRLADWQNWSKFRLWRNTRPLWGSILMIIAGFSMLVGASFFLSLAFLVQSLWPAILVGGLLLVMGLIQLFLPSYAVITGSIGMVLSLVSLLVASFGGCGLGMLLGVIGSALSIAWRPVKRSRLIGASSSSTS